MKKTLLALAVSALPAFAWSQDKPQSIDSCSSQVPYGIPRADKTDSTLICRNAYLTEHDNKARIPRWTSYVLTPMHATGCERRSNAFAPDYSLQKGRRAELSDYEKSGYDIGHVANAADMSWEPSVERESFILSNMTPQLPGFNRGIWKRLEDRTRALAVARNTPLLVYAGPIYKYDYPTIGKNRVIIPAGFYKILIDTTTKEVLVYEFKHEPSSKNLDEFIVDLDKVQQHTGITFPMPRGATFSTKTWPSKAQSARAMKKEVCEVW